MFSQAFLPMTFLKVPALECGIQCGIYGFFRRFLCCGGITNMKLSIPRNCKILTVAARGEYNVENLKLSRRCHKSCKTQPEGKKLSFIFQ